MHTISEIKEFSKSKNRIEFDDESFIVVYKGMYKGDSSEMSEDEYEGLTKEMTAYGKKRAMNLLIKKSYSRRALEKKLEDDGYNPEIIKKIYEFLDSFHYLNDGALAESIIRNYKDTKSKAEIRFLLKKREIPDQIADQAMEEFYMHDEFDEDDGIDPEMKAVVKLLKKLSITPEKIAAMDFKERQKLAAKFYRKGFKAENISKALKLESFE